MRRILNACLLQTMRFDTMNDANPEQELEQYCSKLDKKNTKYVIDDKQKEADGSIVIKIKKQYNTYKTGEYLN